MQQFQQPEFEDATEKANAWVARFAPLLLTNEIRTESELRRQLANIDHLRASADSIRADLGAVLDPELASTFEKASTQLDSIEEDLRKQLAKLAPGDPAGIADLDALNEKLHERLARQEIGVATTLQQPEILKAKVSPPNWAGASFMGIFGLGWTAFTTVHAILMIGGMYSAFGFAALAMLLFYAIFFFAGFGMLNAALNMASDEEIELDGHRLKIIRSFGFWTRVKEHEIDTRIPAELRLMDSDFTPRRSNTMPKPQVVLHSLEGREIGIGASASGLQKERLRDQINAYLRSRV